MQNISHRGVYFRNGMPLVASWHKPPATLVLNGCTGHTLPQRSTAYLSISGVPYCKKQAEEKKKRWVKSPRNAQRGSLTDACQDQQPTPQSQSPWDTLGSVGERQRSSHCCSISGLWVLAKAGMPLAPASLLKQIMLGHLISSRLALFLAVRNQSAFCSPSPSRRAKVSWKSSQTLVQQTLL